MLLFGFALHRMGGRSSLVFEFMDRGNGDDPSAGFNPGPVNGELRAATMQAVNAYQQSKGLPVDGYLNLETVKSLGVSPN